MTMGAVSAPLSASTVIRLGEGDGAGDVVLPGVVLHASGVNAELPAELYARTR
jgi:hypothetical protein